MRNIIHIKNLLYYFNNWLDNRFPAFKFLWFTIFSFGYFTILCYSVNISFYVGMFGLSTLCILYAIPSIDLDTSIYKLPEENDIFLSKSNFIERGYTVRTGLVSNSFGKEKIPIAKDEVFKFLKFSNDEIVLTSDTKILRFRYSRFKKKFYTASDKRDNQLNQIGI